MDPLVPGGALGGAAALSASTARDALLEKLKTGEWTYPETKWGEVNLSVVFDLIFVIAFVLLWIWAVWNPGDITDRVKKLKGTRSTTLDDATRDAIVNYCMKGNFNGNQNYGLFKYVNFFTMEEFTNWLSVSFICTIIALKIICGAANVNSGYIIFIVIVGVVARHMRLGIKDQPMKQLPVALFLVAMFLTLWAYTDAFGTRKDDKSSTDYGQNWVYVFAGVVFLVAAGVKTLFSVSDMGKLSEEDVKKKADALYNGEFAFHLTGASTAIIGATITAFVFCESMFIAYAATDYYAIPFYFLYSIPFYFLFSGLYFGFVNRRTVNAASTGFNVSLVLVGVTVLVLAQGHVCSLPGPNGRHIEKNGCSALKTIGFKSLEPGASELEMKTLPLAFLGICSILTHVMLYAGARFSRIGLLRTIDEVCVKAEDTKYSVP